MGTNDYESDILTRLEQMRPLSSAGWDLLAEQSGNPTLGYDWIEACAQTLCAEGDLRIIVVRQSGRLCALAPLVMARRNGLESLELLGVSALYEPAGLLYDGPESLHYLVQKIISLRMPTVLDRIPERSGIETKFRELSRYRGVMFSAQTASAAYVPVRGSWESYFHSISAQRRYDFQRKRKRMERIGHVNVRIERPDTPDAVMDMLPDVFRIEGAGWKQRSGSALVVNERVRNFIACYSALASSRRLLRLCFLEVNRHAIATILAVEYARRFWVLKVGYDEKWARCSPGIQLTMETVRYAFEEGLDGYEFLGSEEPWQATWPRQRHSLMSLVLYPISPQGLMGLSSDLQRYAVNKAKHYMAASFRT